jgi:HemK-related putative methylase
MNFYKPAEDSIFLSKILKEKVKSKNLKALDLGTGSAIQSHTLIEIGIKKENITAIDINPEALTEAKKLGVKTLKSNLLENTNEKYDLIAFNPPYLPESEFDNEPDTTGGKHGDEVILTFIKQLRSHLTKTGICYLLTSSLTPEKNWMSLAKKERLTVKKIATEKIFFEELYIWEITSQ